MDWFLYDKDLRHERVKGVFEIHYWNLAKKAIVVVKLLFLQWIYY